MQWTLSSWLHWILFSPRWTESNKWLNSSEWKAVKIGTVTKQAFLTYTKCLGWGWGEARSSRIFPPTTHYGTDKVLLCAVLINFPVGFKDLQQLCATLMHEKHRDSRCPSLGALAGFAPHTSLLGSHQLQSWEFGKIHLPLWEITVIIIEKEILGILSSCWKFQHIPAAKEFKFLHLRQSFSTILVCFVHLIDQSLVINSIDSLPAVFYHEPQADFIGRSIWDLVNNPLALGNDISELWRFLT